MARLLSVSLPDELIDEAEALARESGRSKSELVREALRDYTAAERWRRIRRYGGDRAELAGVGPEDVENLIDELREQSAAES